MATGFTDEGEKNQKKERKIDKNDCSAFAAADSSYKWCFVLAADTAEGARIFDRERGVQEIQRFVLLRRLGLHVHQR